MLCTSHLKLMPLKNATTDKLNVNPLLICEEASLIFRRLEVVHSLPPMDNSKSSENQTSNQMRRLSLLSPGHARGAGGRGFK